MKNVLSTVLLVFGILSSSISQPIHNWTINFPEAPGSSVYDRFIGTTMADGDLLIAESVSQMVPAGIEFTKTYLNRIDAVTGASVSRFEVSQPNPLPFPSYNQFDNIVGITKDALGNIYIAGRYFYNANYNTDAIIIKYSSSLVEQWRRYIFSPSGTAEIDYSIDICQAGTSLFVLVKQGPSGYYLVKFDDAGTQQYYVPITGYTPYKVCGNAIGECYVLGSSTSTTGNGSQATLQKFSAGGTSVWKKNFNAVTGDFDDYPGQLTLDPSGNIYFTASSERAGTTTDAYLVKYNTAGTRLWAKYVNGTANTNDFGGYLTINPAGDIFVAHSVIDVNAGVSNQNIFLRKYSTTGTSLASRTYRGSSNATDYATGLVYSSNGRLYLGGASITSTTKRSLLAQYDDNLNLESTDIKVHTETPDPFIVLSNGVYGSSLVFDEANLKAYWLGGRYENYPVMLDNVNAPIILSYDIPAVPRLSSMENESESLLVISPNPASDKIAIKSAQRLIHLEIVDLNGRKIFTANESDGNISNTISIQDWENGLYVVSVILEDGSSLNSKFLKI